MHYISLITLHTENAYNMKDLVDILFHVQSLRSKYFGMIYLHIYLFDCITKLVMISSWTEKLNRNVYKWQIIFYIT